MRVILYSAVSCYFGMCAQGWVVQKLVNFNTELSENSRSNFFSKKRFTLLLNYCFDFQRKKSRMNATGFERHVSACLCHHQFNRMNELITIGEL